LAKRLPLVTLFVVLLLFGAAISACGGGGGGAPGASGNILPASSPTPCPQGYVGQPSPPDCVQVASLPGQFTPVTQPSATAIPQLAGYGGTFGGTILVPEAQVATTVNMTIANAEPTPTPALPVFDLAQRDAMRRDATTNTPLLYITLSIASGTVVFTTSSSMPTGFPGFDFTLPPEAGSGPFYLAWLENRSNGSGGTWTTVAGPETASNGSVTLQPVLSSLTILPSTPVYLVLYTGGVVPSIAPNATPTPIPTTTASTGATASPTGVSGSASPGSSPSTQPTSSTSSSPVSSPSSGASGVPSASPTAHSSATPTVPPATTTPSAFPSTSPTPLPTVAPNGSPPASFTMGTMPSAQWGTALSAATFGFQVLDASGNAIAGSFSKDVTVSSNNGAVLLSILGSGTAASQSITVTSGTELVAMQYSGAAISGSTVTISASATGATNNSIAFTPASAAIVGAPSQINLYPGNTSVQFTATQAGYTGSYGNTITATPSAACANFAQVSPSSGTTFTVSTIASPSAGTCTLTLGGANGSTQVITLTYTTLGVILQ
jgi:hypothetical protein